MFTPLKLTDKITLKHRIAMAPLTRSKGNADGTLSDNTAVYYGQRATDGGLIIFECSAISSDARGFAGCPGMFAESHIAPWKKVVDSVHAKGGICFGQIWHAGRLSHPSFQSDGGAPWSSGDHFNPEHYTQTSERAYVSMVQPRIMTTEQVEESVVDFYRSADIARQAGMDGVEVHGANGYLIQQFLEDSQNKRTDKYGNSIENRCRFLIEAVNASIRGVLGLPLNATGEEVRACISHPDKIVNVGLRISPQGMGQGGLTDSDYESLYTYLTHEVLKNDDFKYLDANLCYVHIIENRLIIKDPVGDFPAVFAQRFGKNANLKGKIISASGYSSLPREKISETIEKNEADVIAVGRWFIHHPDVVERLRLGKPLVSSDNFNFGKYGSPDTVHNYIDYPTWQEEQQSKEVAATA